MRCESAITAQTPSTSKSDTEKPEQREAVLEAKGLLYKRLKVEHGSCAGLLLHMHTANIIQTWYTIMCRLS